MDKRVEATIEIIKASDRYCISVSEMARGVGLSPWHFTHLFKIETSKTPLGYLKEVRMQKAEELLAKTLLSLKEVVYSLGLNDRSHFSREFKRRHGLTPRQFMAQHRSYNINKSAPTASTANPATE
jgi:AraC-like DNA-binding protein